VIQKFIDSLPDEKKLLRFRWVGSALLMVGYFTIIHVNVTVGVCIMLFADVFCIPYAIKRKYWDTVFILSFLSAVNISKLVGL